MSNDYNDKSWTDRTNWIVTVIALALVAILSIGLLCALFIRPQEEEEDTVPKDGAVLSETVEDGVSLMSAKIMPMAYAANGVSALRTPPIRSRQPSNRTMKARKPLIGLSNFRTPRPHGQAARRSRTM